MLVGRLDPHNEIEPDIDLTSRDKNNTVSRRHAEVSLYREGLFVEDLDSLNGTYVDGKRLAPGEPKSLNMGNSVRFGAVEMAVHEILEFFPK